MKAPLQSKRKIIPVIFTFILVLTVYQILKSNSLGFMSNKPELLFQQEVVTLGNVNYSSNQTINANKVIFQSGGHLRLTNGATLTVNATEVDVETNYNIDATGNRGRDLGEWCAHNCQCSSGGFFANSQGHEDFEKQKALGDGANRGGGGGPGGFVYINYCNISGTNGGLNNLHINTGGGPGGQGLYLKCPCHPQENFRWGAGNKGQDGHFEFVHNCN